MGATSYLLAIGSNRRHGRHGRPAQVVLAAVAELCRIGIVEAVAPIIDTVPLGPGTRRFANTAVRLSTPLQPPALLAALKSIERRFGRRPGRRWGDRVIDLDILLWSGGAWRSPELTIPHPGIASRDFVLRPLTTIAPDERMPRGAATIRHLLGRLTARRPLSR